MASSYDKSKLRHDEFMGWYKKNNRKPKARDAEEKKFYYYLNDVKKLFKFLDSLRTENKNNLPYSELYQLLDDEGVLEELKLKGERLSKMVCYDFHDDLANDSVLDVDGRHEKTLQNIKALYSWFITHDSSSPVYDSTDTDEEHLYDILVNLRQAKAGDYYDGLKVKSPAMSWSEKYDEAIEKYNNIKFTKIFEATASTKLTVSQSKELEIKLKTKVKTINQACADLWKEFKTKKHKSVLITKSKNLGEHSSLSQKFHEKVFEEWICMVKALLDVEDIQSVRERLYEARKTTQIVSGLLDKTYSYKAEGAINTAVINYLVKKSNEHADLFYKASRGKSNGTPSNGRYLDEEHIAPILPYIIGVAILEQVPDIDTNYFGVTCLYALHANYSICDWDGHQLTGLSS